MGKSVTVRGRVADPTHIELDEALSEMTGAVEIVLRPLAGSGATPIRRSLLGLCADLGSAPSAAEIDDARRETFGRFGNDAE